MAQPGEFVEAEWEQLALETGQRITRDVEEDRAQRQGAGYMGHAIERPRKQRWIHPLELPGQDGHANEELITIIAEASATWHIQKDSISEQEKQLVYVRKTFFPRDKLKAYNAVSADALSKRLRYLSDKTSINDEDRSAHRIYIAAAALQDMLHLSMPRKDSEEFAQPIFDILRAAIEKFEWEITDGPRKDTKENVFLQKIDCFIEQWWDEKGDGMPMKENIHRAAYRIGLMLGLEEPILDLQELLAFRAASPEVQQKLVLKALASVPPSNKINDRFYSTSRRAKRDRIRRQHAGHPTSMRTSRTLQSPFFVLD